MKTIFILIFILLQALSGRADVVTDTNILYYTYQDHPLKNDGFYLSTSLNTGNLSDRLIFFGSHEQARLEKGDDLIQSEGLAGWEHYFSKTISLSLNLKYSQFDNAYLDSSILAGGGTKYNWEHFSLSLNLAYARLKSELSNKKIDTYQTCLGVDFHYQAFLINIKWWLYEKKNSGLEDEQWHSLWEFNPVYYFENCALFGGFTTGTRHLLHTYDHKYLNTVSDDLLFAASGGVVIFPDDKWSLTYEYKESIYEEPDQHEYVTWGHLINLLFKW